MLQENVYDWDPLQDFLPLQEHRSGWTAVQHVRTAFHIVSVPPNFSFSFHFLCYFLVVDGLQVQYFSASTTCTGAFTTMVYPVGSSTGGNCYPLQNTYLSQALQLYNLGLGSFKPMCMFITPTTAGVPGKGFYVRSNRLFALFISHHSHSFSSFHSSISFLVSPDFQRSALVERYVVFSILRCYPNSIFISYLLSLWFSSLMYLDSVYQYPGGCLVDSVFNLPDVFKAFVQTTPLVSYCASKTSAAQAIAPYNTNAIGQVTCPNSAVFAFAGNFDGACVVTAAGVGSTVEHNKCYGPSKFTTTTSPIIGTNAYLPVNPSTLPSLSNTFSLAGATNCRNTCLKIYPSCARPTGQPTMQPSSKLMI